MESSPADERFRPAPGRTLAPALQAAWLWVLVLGIGLALVFLSPMVDRNLIAGANAARAKQALLRLWQGEFGLRWEEAFAIVSFAGWLTLKPLCAMGALLLLEFRFSPPGAEPKSYLLAWIVQGLFLAGLTATYMLGQRLHLFPTPWITVAPDGSWLSLGVTVAAFLLTLLVMDFFEYWGHRAQHRFAFLWRFHAVHHSVEVDVLHNIRHPFDQIPLVLFVTVPISFVIGVSATQLYLLVAFTSLQTHLNHTRLPIHLGPFRNLLCDNRYHFIHHSRSALDRDRNFAGRFPIFDRLFGTYRAPPDHLVETGLDDRAAPRRFGDYLLARLPDR